MRYSTNQLAFRTLRTANAKQLALLGAIDNYYTLLNHTDDSILPLNSWLRTVITELGDYIDTERFDIPEVTRRLADTIIHVDILAYQLNIDLGEGVVKRWNQKAQELKTPIALNTEYWYFTRELRGEERSRLRGETRVSLRPAEEPTNKIVPCPRCGEEGESLAEQQYLTCAYCDHSWTYDPPATAAQIRIRALLESIAANNSENPREDAAEVLKLMKVANAR